MVGDSPDADPGDRTASSDTSVDGLFDLLTDERRRTVLKSLRERDKAISLSELAEDVAARESEEPQTAVQEETVQNVATSLYHSHVPKLAAAGVVEYDRDGDLVAVSKTDDSAERVFSLADSLGGTEDGV